MKKNESSITIEDDMLLLQEKSKALSHISIGEVLQTLSRRGPPLIIIFLSLPFCQPIQIPGVSTPFGIAIAFVALKMAFGKNAWLPDRILKTTITDKALRQITSKLLWLLKKMERLVYPRFELLCNYPAHQVVNGLLIFTLAIFLAIPFPIPFTNLIAAWPMFFLGLGLLEDDGLVILIGYVLTFVAFVFFLSIFLAVKSIF